MPGLLELGRTRVERGMLGGRRPRIERGLTRHEVVRSRVRGRVIRRGSRQVDRRRRIRGGRLDRFVNIGSPFHLANEGLRRVLHVTDQLTRPASNLRQLIGSEQQQSDGSGDSHVGDREHAEGFFPKLLNGTRPGKYDESSVDRLY